jgi:hypothetical protein
VVHTYGWYLRKYVEDTKAQGATPIICSLIPWKTWKNGKIERGAASYGGWAEVVAKQERVAFVDLNGIIADHEIVGVISPCVVTTDCMRPSPSLKSFTSKGR